MYSKALVFLFVILGDMVFCYPQSKESLRDREDIIQLEMDESGQCIFMHSEEGTFSYISPGSQQVCGFYVITEPDKQVVFEIDNLDVSCVKGGLLSVIDGWELNGQFFPGQNDHPKPPSDRFAEYCGLHKPRKPFITSQNVGLLMFRIPARNEGMTVTVRFLDNPKPCNAVLQNPNGIYTLRNYGRRSNCSVTIMFPESLRILATSIGTQGRYAVRRNMDVETRIIKKCKKRGIQDYVEVLGGDGLDPGFMTIVEDFCGMESRAAKRPYEIFCGNTGVRLVSSGEFENSVTVSFDLLFESILPNIHCPEFNGFQ